MTLSTRLFCAFEAESLTSSSMHIWIDLANSPHVPFFHALIPEFDARGHTVEITARDFAQTVELAALAGMMAHLVGGHGGGSITGKAGNLVGRATALRKWARNRGFDLAVSHNSYAQIAAAAALGIKSATLMDYEYQPANHLAFRLAGKVIGRARAVSGVSQNQPDFRELACRPTLH